MNKLIFLICGVLITMSPTLSFAKVSKKVWCKDRYLNQVEQKYGTIYTPTEEIVAEKGYIYSTLGAIALQKDNKPNADYTFVLPNNVEQIDHISAENSEPAKKSGFEARTFIIKDEISKRPKELVIAFTGSNQLIKDWIMTDFGWSEKQYEDAKNYVKAMRLKANIDTTNPLKVVVTGYSLGGALAGHVTKDPETTHYIHEAWLFNPSFRLKIANYDRDPRFWLGTTRKDMLKLFSSKKFLNIFPDNQRFTDAFLISSGRVYAHFRWTFTRNMLWAADLKFFKDGYSDDKNPAFQIIQKANFDKKCKTR